MNSAVVPKKLLRWSIIVGIICAAYIASKFILTPGAPRSALFLSICGFAILCSVALWWKWPRSHILVVAFNFGLALLIGFLMVQHVGFVGVGSWLFEPLILFAGNLFAGMVAYLWGNRWCASAKVDEATQFGG